MPEDTTAVNNTNKVFDITRPGKSAPSATSKPVIITNRPALKDPMMVDEEDHDTSQETAGTPLLSTVSKIKLAPIHDDVVAEDSNDPDKITVTADEAVDKQDVAAINSFIQPENLKRLILLKAPTMKRAR